MYNLIIIGNGFDLAHGLGTRYTDFIEDVINSQTKKDGYYPDLVSFKYREPTNESGYDYLKNYYNTLEKKNQFEFHNPLFKSIFKLSVFSNWSDIERLYFLELNKIATNDSLKLYNTPHALNQDFDLIKECLELYLSKDEFKSVSLMSSFSRFFNKLNPSSSIILDFNYTNLVKSYIHSNEFTHIKIHGEINNPKNPIIFGYAATQSESDLLLDTGEKEYFRNIKRYNYKESSNEHLLNEQIQKFGDICVSNFGHSCGISDSLILYQIFTNSNVKKIRNYYFDGTDEDKYFELNFNIDRIIRSEENFGKLVSKNESHRHPQHIDDNVKIRDFINFAINSLENQKSTHISLI